MNVLFCARSNLLTHPAGDTIQVQKSAEYLRQGGISVEIGPVPSAQSDYEVIHLWGLHPIEEIYPAFERARLSGAKIAVSPIYWNLSRYYTALHSIDRLAQWNWLCRFRREILQECDKIFVSGHLEMHSLQQDIGVELPYTVVPNGVDARVFHPKEEASAPQNSYILCTARICPRKNQLALAKACAAMNRPLILAGSVGNQRYLQQCLAYEQVQYAGVLDWEALSKLYEQAELHVLASYVETPGLATLEAACMGCNVVSTAEGDASEYLENLATYCDPYQAGSIEQAIADALSHSFQPQLRQHLLAHYQWEECLAPLLQGYQEWL